MSENRQGTGLWMIPFADLMSTLVILFLALYGFSFSMKKSDYETAMAKLQKEMGREDAAKKVKEMELTKKVEDELKKHIQEGNLGVEVTTAKIRLTFASPILFDSGSAALKPGALEILRPVAANIVKMGNPVVVEGHTDAARMLGKKFRSNRELSLMRAFSVIDFMVREGVPPARASAVGYGEFRPAAANDTEEGRAKNRRIEIIILRQETPAGDTEKKA